MTKTGTLKRVIKAFDWQLHKKDYIPMSGQIVGASLVPAPRQRNTEDEKAAVKAGKSSKGIWSDGPNKATKKDVDARWTLKIGGKSHISIDKSFGFIRVARVIPAIDPDGRQLKHLIDKDNAASDVWADSACCSQNNEK